MHSATIDASIPLHTRVEQVHVREVADPRGTRNRHRDPVGGILHDGWRTAPWHSSLPDHPRKKTVTDRTPTVLFICQHNAGRSQLGAALLEHLAGDRFIATSAGLAPADEVNPAVAATVAELGVDITDRVPRAVTDGDLEHADVVVLMKPGLVLPSTPRGEVLEWSFPNPEAWDADAVRPLREAVSDKIQATLFSR